MSHNRTLATKLLAELRALKTDGERISHLERALLDHERKARFEAKHGAGHLQHEVEQLQLSIATQKEESGNLYVFQEVTTDQFYLVIGETDIQKARLRIAPLDLQMSPTVNVLYPGSILTAIGLSSVRLEAAR